MTTPPYRWCVLYLDTSDEAAVVADTARLLGPGTDLDVFRASGCTVRVAGNPDRTRGPHFLDWATTVAIDADETQPDRDVVAFVTVLIAHLRTAGHRIGADADFADQLPPPDPR